VTLLRIVAAAPALSRDSDCAKIVEQRDVDTGPGRRAACIGDFIKSRFPGAAEILDKRRNAIPRALAMVKEVAVYQRISPALAAWIIVAGVCSAQDRRPRLGEPVVAEPGVSERVVVEPLVTEQVTTTDDKPAPTETPVLLNCFDPCARVCVPRCWASADYLYWWVNGNPIPALATLGDPTDAIPGALGQPGTTVLFDERLSYTGSNGGRAFVGGWLGCEERLGWEIGGFLFENHANQVSWLSPLGSATTLQVPVLSDGPVEDATIPLTAFGAETRLQMYSAEANLLYNVRRSDAWTVDLLAGARYLDLDERLALDYVVDFGFATQVGGDRFRTQNHFYAGQLGSKIGYQGQRWSLDVISKVALGGNRRTLRTSGFTNFDGQPVFPGAIFTGPSNTGRFVSDKFAVLPELTVQAGFSLTKNIRATAGYNVLYLNNVARAGDSIDRLAFTEPGPGVTIGETDFWAHGLSVGIQVRW